MIRILVDQISFLLLNWPVFRRFATYLTYQKKRHLRRQVESRLRTRGLYGDTVVQGPFKGLVYPDPSLWASCRFEKIFGIYECELFPQFERIFASGKSYSSICVIGAAEGFYVAGLARMYRGIPVFAFEPTQQKFEVMRALVEINGLKDQVEINGFCSPVVLNRTHLGDAPLVVCDVDGYEDVIMSIESVPALAKADIVLELHDFIVPKISETIRGRFEGTHSIDVVRVSGTRYEDFPILNELNMTEILAMTESDRPFIHNWYIMRAK